MLKFNVELLGIILGGRCEVLDRFWRIFFKFVLLVLVVLILNKLVEVGNFLIFLGIIFNLFELVMDLVVVILGLLLEDLFSFVVVFWNVVLIMKLVVEIVVRLKVKFFVFIVLVMLLLLFFLMDFIFCWLFGVFVLFFGSLLVIGFFLMMYLLVCFCFSKIFSGFVRVDCFGVLGFFFCFLKFIVVLDVFELVLMLVVENENVGEIEEKGKVLKVGEGVFKVNDVKDGDVLWKIGVFGLDGVFIVVLNKVVLGGRERLVSLVDGWIKLIGSGSFLLVLIGSLFSLIFCVFFMI